MSEKFGLMSTASVQNQYLDGQAYMDCAQTTAAEVDAEVKSILDAAYADAKRILTENRSLLDEVSEFLLVKETITGDELMAYVNADKNRLPEAAQQPESHRRRADGLCQRRQKPSAGSRPAAGILR